MAFLAAMLSMTSAAPAAALVTNGGFETGSLAPWYQDRAFGGTEDWNVTDALAHTGSYSATVVGNNEIRQDFGPIATSEIAAFSFWMLHPNLATAPSFVSLFYLDDTSTGFVVFTSSTDWQEFDIVGNLAPGKMLTGFSVFGYVGGESEFRTYLDDVSIIASVPEAETWVMMLFGFGAIGFAMRRRRSQTHLTQFA